MEIETTARPSHPNAWQWDSGQDVRLTALAGVLTALADVLDWTDGYLIGPDEPVPPLALAGMLKQAVRDIEEFTRPDA